MYRVYSYFCLPFSLQGNVPKCEGCGKTDKLEKFNKFQCGEHRFCEECRNRTTCPVHPWLKLRFWTSILYLEHDDSLWLPCRTITVGTCSHHMIKRKPYKLCPCMLSFNATTYFSLVAYIIKQFSISAIIYICTHYILISIFICMDLWVLL